MGGKGCRYFVGRWNGGLLGAEIGTCNCCHSSQIRKSECSFLFILIFLYKMCTGKAVLHSPYKKLKKPSMLFSSLSFSAHLHYRCLSFS